MPPRKKKAAASAAADTAAAAADEPATKTAKVTLKAGAKVPVDPNYGARDSYHVYVEDGVAWDFTGNQTNIGNNNNKFYILQLLESDSGKNYVTWTRWGRVGATGQSMEAANGALDHCKHAFCAKFKDKTKNAWGTPNFTFVKGKYDWVKIDYTEDAAEADGGAAAAAEPAAAADNPAKKKKKEEPASKLNPQVKSLIELIFDVKKMTEAVVEMNFDVHKMPLGKLTKEQIRNGYESLKQIEDLLKRGASRAEFQNASDLFYTRIPHSFGFKVPPVIDTEAKLKEKLQLIEALDDIKAAMSIIEAGGESTEAKVDTHYKSLKCGLEPVDPKSDEFKMVNTYLQNTHGKTHQQYSLQIIDLFKVDKDTSYKGGKNKKLLWHGSRLTNWGGILSQGLRIAPPEAPVTGYMFGKGVYFADCSSKSANYCYTSRGSAEGIMLLCEVALGEVEERVHADSTLHLTLPKNKHSCLGKGRVEPDPAQNVVIDGDVVVPLGTLRDVPGSSGLALQYNECIVYSTQQIKFRYALRLRFNYH